jgi:hypothetical protein
VELADMRFELIARYAKDNAQLAGENLRMLNAAERYARQRKVS